MSVPEAWTRLQVNLHAALIERDILKGGLSAPARDDAVQRYTRAVDLIVADLEALKTSHVMGQITLFFAKKERV